MSSTHTLHIDDNQITSLSLCHHHHIFNARWCEPGANMYPTWCTRQPRRGCSALPWTHMAFFSSQHLFSIKRVIGWFRYLRSIVIIIGWTPATVGNSTPDGEHWRHWSKSVVHTVLCARVQPRSCGTYDRVRLLAKAISQPHVHSSGNKERHDSSGWREKSARVNARNSYV